MKKVKKWTKSEIAKFPPHIQKAMSMTYDIEPFLEAGVIAREPPPPRAKKRVHRKRGA